MNAIELADRLDTDGHIYRADSKKAAKMLRRQHEAIVKLRVALGDVMKLNNGEPEFVHAFKVLDETMGIAK